MLAYYTIDWRKFHVPGLMITASHQTFSGQLWHLTDQTKFDQTNLLYIINGEVNKFIIGKQMSRQFSTLIISTDVHRRRDLQDGGFAKFDRMWFFSFIYVTGFGKTCIVHTSDFARSKIYKTSLEQHTDLKFAGMIEE